MSKQTEFQHERIEQTNIVEEEHDRKMMTRADRLSHLACCGTRNPLRNSNSACLNIDVGNVLSCQTKTCWHTIGKLELPLCLDRGLCPTITRKRCIIVKSMNGEWLTALEVVW